MITREVGLQIGSGITHHPKGAAPGIHTLGVVQDHEPSRRNGISLGVRRVEDFRGQGNGVGGKPLRCGRLINGDLGTETLLTQAGQSKEAV